MATSKKIVDTRKLASKGRYGDTKLRDVGGEISHVNAYEAYLIDNYNKRGEDTVKARGSGTINPETGRREYWHGGDHWDEFWSGASDFYESTLGSQGLTGAIEGNIKNVVSGWEWLTPSGGTEWFGHGPSKGKKMERQAGDIISGGLENLQTQYGQYMGNAGPDGIVGTEDDVQGFVGQEQDIREKGLKSKYDIAMGGYDISGKKLDVAGKTLSRTTGGSYKELGDIGNIQRSKSNLAYSGTAEEAQRIGKKTIGSQYAEGLADIQIGRENIELGRTGTQAIYDIGLESSGLTTEKQEADFMAGLRKQMNQMMIDYQAATKEAYPGSAGMDELNRIFAEYSKANV